MCPKFLIFKSYINFLLRNIANSPFFNINLSLFNINMLLYPRFYYAAIPTISFTTYFNTLI